jgi:hypothetical protein
MPRKTTASPRKQPATQSPATIQDGDRTLPHRRTTPKSARTGKRPVRANPADVAPAERPIDDVQVTSGQKRPSKLDQLVDLLQRPEGAGLADLASLTGWQAHSIRGAIAGSLKRKGHVVSSERIDGMRRYRIVVAP